MQHDSVLFFQAVWSKIQRACQRKMGKQEKWGRNGEGEGETNRQRDWVLGYTTEHQISCSFMLMMMLILASDVSFLFSLKAINEKERHAFNNDLLCFTALSLH